MKRYWLAALGFLVLVLGFQNCTGSLLFKSTSSSLKSQHGQGYGGIKDGIAFYVKASDVTYQFPLTVNDVDYYTINPPLPAGLNLDSQTGLISGTPVDVTSDYFPYDFVAVQKNGQTVSVNPLIGVGYVYYVSPNVNGLGLPDANLSDHICADSAGVCSLQAALDQSAANPVKTRIIIPSKTYLSQSGGLLLNANVELVGGGQGSTVFDGQDINRVLNISAINVTLKNLTITRGKILDPEYGAGIVYQNPAGKLEIYNVEISYNNAETLNRGGGGLYFSGVSLFIQGSRIHHNTKTWSGANPGGGGLYLNNGQLWVKDSVIEDNSADFGGGVYVMLNARPTFENVIVARNHAVNRGGGLFAFNGDSITIKKSIFMDNQTITGEGGAIGITYLAGSGEHLLIENTTFAQNQADTGGVIGFGNSACTFITNQMVIRNSTFVGNTATSPEGGDVFDLTNNCTIKMVNSVIGLNGAKNCRFTGNLQLGQIISQGSNIDSSNSCTLSAPNDLINTDPLLGSLTQLGGTYLYPLLSGSPAIDSGDNSQCLGDDQRGVMRPQGTGCDRGTFEF